MCFSAAASFSVAAATAAAGVFALRGAAGRRDVLLAAVPLLFAAQQAIEGVLWLRLTDGGRHDATDAALAAVFLFVAKVVWPVYPALALLPIETDPLRRLVLTALGTLGVALSVHLLLVLDSAPVTVTIAGHSIVYAASTPVLSWQTIPYLACTCLPLLVSSHRFVRLFGAVVLAGFAVSAAAYAWAYISVWCFFAAVDSVLLVAHFRHVAARARATLA
jgi:hypothetical protein